ncbi:hypothetical protein [Promicromonospora sp. MEB111]|uniref:hypothetical protein n=1 Tax=unclassified Promicromonospora TaxID=2647929 RepID=UPI00254BADBA|nr:hypothetical protein [Promicromonospora sp. MEB111]
MSVSSVPGFRELHAHGPSSLAESLTSMFQTEAWSAADGDSRVARQLREIGVDVSAIWAASRWNMGDDGDAPNRRHPVPGDPRGPETAAALRAVVDRPRAAALLGVYLWSQASDALQYTFRHGRIIVPLRAFVETWETYRDRAPDDVCRAEGDAVAVLLRTLITQMHTAAARSAGDLLRVADAAGRAGERCGELLQAARAIPDPTSPFRRALVPQAVTRVRYFRALAEAARAASDAMAGEPDRLGPALDGLRAAETDRHLNYILASELRSYRMHLTELHRNLDSTWLTLDRLRTVYIYPFGLRDVRPAAAVTAIRRLAHRDEHPELLGVQAFAVRGRLKMDDVWASVDRAARPYGGASLSMPNVRLEQPDGTFIAELSCDVRFTEFGNHYVRFRYSSRDQSPQQVRDARFRLSNLHADIRVRWIALDGSPVDVDPGGALPPERLFDLADLLQRATADLVRKGTEIAQGRAHVVTTVYEASRGRGPAAPPERRTPVTMGDEMLAAFGSQVLLQPVSYGTATLCDWTLRQRNPVLLEGVRHLGDVVAVATNSTTVALVGTAHFKISQYGSLAEFVASLNGLFSAWNATLADHLRIVATMLADHDVNNGADLADRKERLTREQLRLHEFASEVRTTLTTITSPTFLASALESRMLNQLLHASRFEQQAAVVTERLRELLQEPIAARLAALERLHGDRERAAEARRERSRRRLMDGTLSAITVFAGVYALIGTVQVALDASLIGPIQAVTATALVTVGALVTGWAVFNWTSRR